MILYLSATGNTRWAANRLSEITGERLKSVTDFGDGDVIIDLEADERLGVCFPVHAWRPPTIICKFIERLKVNSPTPFYFYSLCTAGDTVGEAMNIFEKLLRNYGYTLDSCFSILMPESYVGLPFMDVDKLDKEAEKKQIAEERIREIGQLIFDRQRNIQQLTYGKWPKTNSRLLGWYFYKHLITDRKFWVNETRCTHCGKCSRICPVDNITMSKEKYPEWKHNGLCMTCFACYHHCPTHAIEFGKQTRHKGQYFYDKNNIYPI
jgi:NAD-dependent dihydropyrimidine dehydrogenase PreA subunit/flavodoxin